MPIRIVDKGAIIGRIAPTLSSATAALNGTFSAAPGRTGSMSTLLANHTPAFTGVFQVNANRVGSVASTLGDATATFFATVPGGAAPSATFTANIGTDPGIAFGAEPLFYGEAHLTTEGLFMDVNTGDHGNSDNAVRGFNPHSTSRTDATGVARSAQTGWKRSPTQIGAVYTQHDNVPSVFIASEKKYMQFGSHGCLYDITTGGFIYANTSPSSPMSNFWTNFMHRRPQDVLPDEFDLFVNNWLYNSQAQYVPALDMIYFGGGFPGGAGNPGLQRHWRIERTVPADGVSQPWKLREFAWPSNMPAADQPLRNNIAAVGPNVYVIMNGRRLFRIDVRVMTSATELATRPSVGDEYYSNLIYNEDWKGLVWVGADGLLFYDLDANTWSDRTPSGMQHMHGWHGDYEPETKAAYFRGGLNFDGGSPDFSQSPQWRKFTFSAAPSSKRWTLVQVPNTTASSPFKGPPELGFGGTKHVHWQRYPVNGRIYTYGGDFGQGSADYSFEGRSMGNDGTSITTYHPTAPRTYTRDSSFCGDQYSLDPTAASPTWRLEEPYFPRNLSGTLQRRPPRTCQKCLVWDSSRNKFWAMLSFVRLDAPYLDAGGSPDQWANGETTAVNVDPGNGSFNGYEQTATFSWLPGASGAGGTWTHETDARILYRSGATTRMVGNVLVTGLADERAGYWCYDPKNDVIVGMGFGALFIFKPATKTYEWRVLSVAGFSGGSAFFNTSSSCCDVIDGWLYCVAGCRATDSSRSSRLMRINLAAALARANGATLQASDYEHTLMPWSISGSSAWENGNDYSSKWQEEVGVIAIDRKIQLLGSYRGIINGGQTKVATYNPDTGRFLQGDAPPENSSGNSWVALPDTGEVLVGLNTNGYSNLKLWKYRVR